jgi:hypothetical protein
MSISAVAGAKEIYEWLKQQGETSGFLPNDWTKDLWGVDS